MSKITIAIFALGLVTVALPLAAADETKADCEPGQQWIGYQQTDAFRTLVWSSPVGHKVTPCEGEHWDGQDNVQPGQNTGTGPTCTKNKLSGTDPNNFFFGNCMNRDPNEGAADPTGGNGQPLTFRVSRSAQGGTDETYIALNVGLVGRAVVYVGKCDAGSRNLEGAAGNCASSAYRAGAYIRDDTPPNALAQVISAGGITKGHVSESDCNQTKYAEGANAPNGGDRSKCGRENTAITVDLLP